jgi:hypothetical protein
MMRWRLASNIALVAIIITLQACNVQAKHGAATPDLVVEEYILALETRDDGLMTKLQPQNSASKATAPTIYRLGGHQFQDLQFKYTKTKPTLRVAKITAVYLDRNNIRHKFEDTISIIYQSTESWKLYRGRWYLSLNNSDLNR